MLYDPKWEVKIEADNEIVSVLRIARNIISDKSKWTCGSYARTKRGHQIGPLTDNAVSFCSVGALAVAMHSDVCEIENSAACNFLSIAASEKGSNHPTHLNDKGDHDAAVAMFDRAIELALVSSADQLSK